MRADQANSHLDDITLFQKAIGGPSHGNFLGFGSLLQKKTQTATTRERQQQISSSISGLTTSGDQETFSRAEVDMICKERDRRIAEERAERMRDQEKNQFLFSQLFKMHGLQPPPQVCLNKFRFTSRYQNKSAVVCMEFHRYTLELNAVTSTNTNIYSYTFFNLGTI